MDGILKVVLRYKGEKIGTRSTRHLVSGGGDVMGIGLWIAGFIILFLMAWMVIMGPFYIIGSVILIWGVPLVALLYSARLFSLSPLAFALIRPGDRRSVLRTVSAWLIILASAALVVWSVGAVSLVGLSIRPVTLLIPDHLPPGILTQVEVVAGTALAVSAFLALGLWEVGLPVKALSTLFAGASTWDSRAVYERKLFGCSFRSRGVKDPMAWLLVDLAGVLPGLGLGILVFLPVVVGSVWPHLYSVYHLGGWSPLVKLPGLEKQLTPISYHNQNWWPVTRLFPPHNWPVLWAATPRRWRYLAYVLALLSVLGLPCVVMTLGPARTRRAKKLDQKAREEYKRIWAEHGDPEDGDGFDPSEEGHRYAEELGKYWRHKIVWYPDPEDFGLSAEIIGTRIAERTEKSRESRLTRERQRLRDSRRSHSG